ncbi:MAG: Hsp33 family molecular chaperone HslO [Burkholderiales bacterium]|nr:Hsp33 family molecular chaperone HslO [Burkholderiales bacterium]
MADTLQKFMFENSLVRGELVDISDVWQQVQSKRDYPPAVKKMLGEMLSAAALLSANLKFNGSIIMQIHGDGPVQLLVVECDVGLKLRGMAKLRDEVTIDEQATVQKLINEHGQGRFAITLDPDDKMPGQQAYQGIVALDGESIATIIENYMMRSEQLDTRLWLAADDHVARGLLLQKLPSEGGTTESLPTSNDEDTWDRSVMLASTLTQAELLMTDIMTLLQRLYWEETVRVFDPRYPVFQCTCSRTRVGNMLRMLGQEEIDDALAELGQLSVNCEFCGQLYRFDKVDCAHLFTAESVALAITPPSQQQH